MENFSFPITIYSKLEEINPVLSKARVRIFYRGLNRNNTYITNEFAEKLIKTLPGAPVKGIFEKNELNEESDFSSHGEKNQEGRAYGFVSESPNFKWEDHEDEDGITRTYACADVYLWTALYPEGQSIVGKAQSMELYKPSVEGRWEIREGTRTFVFSEGAFLGLQVLGDFVEPCFEGASFYSLIGMPYEELVSKIEKVVTEFSKLLSDIGGKDKEMPDVTINFKISDREKHDILWNLINPDYNKEGNYEVVATLLDVFDDYAFAYSYEKKEYMRVYFTKTEDSIVIDRIETRKVVDVSESEYAALEAIRALNNDTFEKINEAFVNNGKEALIEEEKKVFTLTEEVNGLNEKVNGLNAEIGTLNASLTALQEYKNSSELAKKEEIITRYSTLLSEEDIKEVKENIETYSILSLEEKLSYILVKKNPTVFSLEGDAPLGIPNSFAPEAESGVDRILKRYREKNNGGKK